MTSENTVLRRPHAMALAIASMLVAARLFVPAAALAFSQRSSDEFRATGLPAWVRIALAVPEMLGAVLFAIPKTCYLGASVLLLDLTGAIIVHLSIGIQPIGLYPLLAAVLSLAIARAYFFRCRLRQ